jgi:hypothetical protein
VASSREIPPGANAKKEMELQRLHEMGRPGFYRRSGEISPLS